MIPYAGAQVDQRDGALRGHRIVGQFEEDAGTVGDVGVGKQFDLVTQWQAEIGAGRTLPFRLQAEAIAGEIAEARIIVHPGIDIGAVRKQPHIVRQVQGEFGFHALVAGISIDDQRRRALLRHRNLEILVLDKVGADAEVELAKRALHAGFVIVEQFGREHPHVGGQHPADAAGIDLHHRRTATTRVGGIKVHVVGGAEQDVGARQEGIKSTRGT